jgi:hypothetical protein
MKLRTTFAMFLAVLGLATTGCAETMQVGVPGGATAADATAPGAQAGGPRWERRRLANGVELLISDEAGVDARKVADDIQSEMRSRYIGAR